jgi:hypothetical protein
MIKKLEKNLLLNGFSEGALEEIKSKYKNNDFTQSRAL